MSNTPRRRYGTLALSSAAAIGLALFVTGCASKPQAKILGARGEVVPTPYYDPTSKVTPAPAPATAAPAPQIIYVQTPPAQNHDQTIYTPAAPSRIAAPEAIEFDYTTKVNPTPALQDPVVVPTVQPKVSKTFDLSEMEAPADLTPTRSNQGAISLSARTGLDTYRELPTMDDAAGITYTVQKGDNLWNIGKSYGVTAQEIAAANSIDPSKYLKIGQVLTIPPGGKLQDSALVGDASSSTSSSSGSSMPSMSARNSVAREAIPASGVYTVAKGDSLWKIGMKYNMTLPTIQGLNPGVGDNLKIGDKVYLTESAARKAGVSATSSTASASKTAFMPSMSARTSSTPSSSHTPTGNTPIPASKQYTVAKGDSLWVISQKFGISIEKLKSINNMSNNKLMPGQVLLLENGAGPVDSTVASYTPPTDTYTPAAETYTPALTAKTTVVATPTPAAPTAPVDLTQMTNLQHFTEPADTLKDIAEMYNSQVDWILKANPTVKGDADLKKMNMVLVPVSDVGSGR